MHKATSKNILEGHEYRTGLSTLLIWVLKGGRGERCTVKVILFTYYVWLLFLLGIFKNL